MHLVAKGIAWATLNQACAPRAFLRRNPLVQDEVPERIPYARQRQALPEVFSQDEVVRFLEAVSSLKCRVALTCAYATGLRVSEVVASRCARSTVAGWSSGSRTARAVRIAT